MTDEHDLIEHDIDAYLERYQQKGMLRFITCGSVDDGKSTLIGRILFDTNMIFEDQMAALETDSQKHGTTGRDIDLALLVDGLQSEREQGITIDVAYRYFSTAKRKFILADTPGHEQYTRNMATGASTAEVAVILIDARKGILVQTRRHSFIVSLLGIRHVIVAVNKMDLIGYDQSRFDSICDEYRQFSVQLGFTEIRFVPVSALLGDNVVRHGDAMFWYRGMTLLEMLETITPDADVKFDALRMPIQYVNRPNPDFRGFCGTIASGVVRKGASIVALPSRKSSRIKAIMGCSGEVEVARASMPVTVTLTDEIDIGRGDVLVHDGQAPQIANQFMAHIVWLNEAPLLPGKQYLFKTAAKITSGNVAGIEYGVNINTLEHTPADMLALNQIGVCRIKLNESIAFDPYAMSHVTGSFIIIDRLTNATCGAGMIMRATAPAAGVGSDNLMWHEHGVTRAMRANQKGQRPCVIWLTGLSGSGKSTIANALEQKLFQLGHHSYLLDGDNIRHGLNKDLDFSDAGRIENIRRIGETAKLFVDAGLMVVTAFISPFRSDRMLVRELLGSGEFFEIYVSTPIEVCEQRDPKGIYRKARSGGIRNFTGIDSPYEIPGDPDLTLDTLKYDVDACVELILEMLRKHAKLLH